jgi:hypothetical protein
MKQSMIFLGLDEFEFGCGIIALFTFALTMDNFERDETFLNILNLTIESIVMKHDILL